MNRQHLNPQQFDRFRDFIYKHSGIRVDARKVSLLSNRLRRRLRAGEFPDFDAYYRHLISRRGADELACFLDAITTNETSFFRTANHFQWLRSEFLPAVVTAFRRGERSPRLRFWSAGCASGAEAYSIAMCVAEKSHVFRDWTVTILGTDISEQTLIQARQGVFAPRTMEAVSDRQKRQFLEHLPESDSWQVKSQLRELVRFRHHNLMEVMPQASFDCIFIRNVLIYFDQASKQSVVQNLIRALVPQGYLVVGPSEGIHGMLHPLVKRKAFLYQNSATPSGDPASGVTPSE